MKQQASAQKALRGATGAARQRETHAMSSM
jgi:hypothetical protein